MGNNLAVTGNLTVGGTLVVTGTTNLGAAADTVLVTNFNADKVDGADLDTDGTLAANSDTKVPSQKAVKTYADARKAECVALTGNQTVGGVKTFSSAPLLPDDTVETADIQALAVTAAKLIKSLGSGGSQVITAAGGTWVPPAGLYMFSAGLKVRMEIYVSGSWLMLNEAVDPSIGGFGWCDGANVRFFNSHTMDKTVWYLKVL